MSDRDEELVMLRRLFDACGVNDGGLSESCVEDLFDDVTRLRALIKSAERASPERKSGEPSCPWCDATEEHDLACSAFKPDGVVR